MIRVRLVTAGKVFTHNCATGNLSALIQCCNIVQQIERDGFQRHNMTKTVRNDEDVGNYSYVLQVCALFHM
jgi:hypothetical protein